MRLRPRNAWIVDELKAEEEILSTQKCYRPSSSKVVNHTLMTIPHPRDPLHGVTLETIVTELVERHGWAELGRRLPVRCFLNNPSVKSSLTFLRKTQWARERVEGMYIAELE